MESSKYRAVVIAPGGKACEAVKKVEGRRFLAVQAPRLPMSDCSQPDECRCRFSKFPDRRDDEDERREHTVSMRSILYSGGERRRSRGRRKAD